MVLFDCAGLYIDVGDKAYTNETLQNIRDSVELVKDHPALLGYYTCKCSRSLCDFFETLPAAQATTAAPTSRRPKCGTQSSS